MKEYHSLLQLRVDWGDLDLFGHVNNVSYFKYAQSARVHFWDILQLLRYMETDHIGPILKLTQCEYILPLYYPDTVTLFTKLDFLKNSSLGFRHVLINGSGQPAAEVNDVIVMYNFKKKVKCAIPESIRAKAESLKSFSDE